MSCVRSMQINVQGEIIIIIFLFMAQLNLELCGNDIYLLRKAMVKSITLS